MRIEVYDISTGFFLFTTNKDVTERDKKGDENKIERFLRDIVYKKRGDTNSYK